MGKCPKIELHSRVHQTVPACILQSHGCTSHILGPYTGALASGGGGHRCILHSSGCTLPCLEIITCLPEPECHAVFDGANIRESSGTVKVLISHLPSGEVERWEGSTLVISLKTSPSSASLFVPVW